MQLPSNRNAEQLAVRHGAIRSCKTAIHTHLKQLCISSESKWPYFQPHSYKASLTDPMYISSMFSEESKSRQAGRWSNQRLNRPLSACQPHAGAFTAATRTEALGLYCCVVLVLFCFCLFVLLVFKVTAH